VGCVEEVGWRGEGGSWEEVRWEEHLRRGGGGGFSITQDRELAERAKAMGVRALLDVYYKSLDFLGEPSAEEIEEGVEGYVWRGVSSTRRP